MPSLSSSSPFDKIIKTMLICDVLTLIGLRGYDKKKVHQGPEDEKKNLSKLSNKLIVHIEESKSMKIEELQEMKAFDGEEDLTNDEINIILEHEEEFSRKGNFSRVFPLAANVDYYAKLFEIQRYNNHLLWCYIRGG